MLRSALFLLAFCCAFVSTPSFAQQATTLKDGKYLFVATPGIRNYLEYGGHGILVFDIEDEHRFVKRIPTKGLNDSGVPSNVKGVAANAALNRLYISTLESLQCFRLRTGELLWEKKYEGGCDRMSLTPDGTLMFLPSLEKDHWHILDSKSGEIKKVVTPKSGAHNTVCGLSGKWAYLAGLRSPILTIVNTSTLEVEKSCGPFTAEIRPFTVNGKETLCFVNVNGLLGFEIGDLETGKKLFRVEVPGFEQGPVKRHGCPSHGVGLTPDEKEIWVTDGHNRRMHIFQMADDPESSPPKYVQSIELRDEPGWITFSLDGKYAYPSTGDVIEVATRKIVTQLSDEKGEMVQSEKMVEVHFQKRRPSLTGDQFGLGRVK